MSIVIRKLDAADLKSALAINEAAVPAVNSLSAERMLWFFENAPWLRCAVREDEVLAILFGFFQGSSYTSDNYRWFARKYPRFAYVDRVAVSDSARRLGIASMLYEDFIAGMPTDIPVLTCEVNTLPPNPGSLRYHERHGFEIVGRQTTENGAKQVALLAKDLKAVT
jgi:predicted GNAT superfamily acetyltransferase